MLVPNKIRFLKVFIKKSVTEINISEKNLFTDI
jgi:hypothetical protein